MTNIQGTTRNISTLYRKILQTLNISRAVLIGMALLFLVFFLIINSLHLNGVITLWRDYFLARLDRLEMTMDDGTRRFGDLPLPEHELRISAGGTLLRSPDPLMNGLDLRESGFFTRISKLESGELLIIFYQDLLDGQQRVHLVKSYPGYYQVHSFRLDNFFPSTLASGTRLAIVSDEHIRYSDNPDWLGREPQTGLLRIDDGKLYLVVGKSITAIAGGQLLVFQDISSDMLLFGSVAILLLIVIAIVNRRTSRIHSDFEMLRREHDELLMFTQRLSKSIAAAGSDPVLMLDSMIPALAEVLHNASEKPLQFDENIQYHALIRSFALELLHLIGLVRDEKENLAKYQIDLEDSIMERTAELTQARDEARLANRAKSNFLANMTHELRTPLNAILGFTQLMGHDLKLPAEHRERLAVINRSGGHLLALINDILEISKIEAGRVELHLQTIALDDFLQGLMDLYSHRAVQKGLELRLALETGLPVRISTDSAKLNQILVNLLGNAIKFTQSGTVTMSVSLVRPADLAAVALGAERNPAICFEVRDTGVGIAVEDQERIFQPFEQIFSTSMGQGSGLGLAITREYVALLGGELNLQSHSGKGSVFSFCLPAGEAVQGFSSGILTRPARMVRKLQPGQREYRVLIAEDDGDNRRLLEDLLLSVGFSVKTAENGKIALDAFKKWKPDFVWMDIHMPEMDGYETIKAIRRYELLANPMGQWYRVPIAAITADSFYDTRTRVLESGCDGIVIKPFKNEEIFRVMAGLLDARFIYADQDESGHAHHKYETEVSCLVPENLAGLDPVLAMRLYQSIAMLDDQLIRELIAEIRKTSEPLADELLRLTSQFEYDAIVTWLQNGIGGMRDE